MIRNIILLFVVLEVFFTSNNFLFAQHKEQISKRELNSKMYIVDTITIQSPLVIKVTDSMGKFQYFLVEKKDLMMIDTLVKQGSEENILKCESLFCPTYKFSCLLNNYINNLGNEKDSVYNKMKESIQKSKAEVWEEFDKNNALTNKSYSIYTINISTFLVILVRHDFLKFCQSRDEIKTDDNDNLYRKILVPITWQTTNK